MSIWIRFMSSVILYSFFVDNIFDKMLNIFFLWGSTSILYRLNLFTGPERWRFCSFLNSFPAACSANFSEYLHVQFNAIV